MCFKNGKGSQLTRLYKNVTLGNEIYTISRSQGTKIEEHDLRYDKKSLQKMSKGKNNFRRWKGSHRYQSANKTNTNFFKSLHTLNSKLRKKGYKKVAELSIQGKNIDLSPLIFCPKSNQVFRFIFCFLVKWNNVAKKRIKVKDWRISKHIFLRKVALRCWKL